MNNRRLLAFSGLFFCLFYVSLIHESSAALKVLNVRELCKTRKFDYVSDYDSAIIEAKGNEPLDCEIQIVKSKTYSIVISLSELNIQFDDSLVFRDSDGTEVSLSGRKTYRLEERSFLLTAPVRIHFVTNDTSITSEHVKFRFVFTVTHDTLCSSNEFECRNRRCIPNNLVCNEHNNCGDRSDEQGCSFICHSEEFHCANKKCIPKYKLCDEYNDCGDNSDEEDCHPFKCNGNEFKCHNGKCIPNHLVCDENNDCGDRSDERSCYRECLLSQFRCRNQKCIAGWLVCNDQNNCGDNSDEANCNRRCLSSEFKCDNRNCIPKSLVCNNRNDCGDRSDEQKCSTNYKMEEEEYKETRMLLLPIILSSVAIGIIIIVLLALSIRYCVVMAKKPGKTSTNTTTSEIQRPAPSSMIGRFRQSFRSHGQPTAPPLEMDSSTESAPPEWQQTPSIISRIRQSFRSNRQPNVQPPNANNASNSRSEDPKVPAIYPHVPPASGTDNPEFKSEE